MSLISPRFPHADRFVFGDKTLSSAQLLELLAPYLTQERQRKIAETVARRTCNVVPVFENLYDRGNVSAVLRSSEGLGYQCAHIIESGDKFKEANRVTQGADKWLDVKRWKTTTECVKELRHLGYQILVTHLDANAVSIADVDVTKPTALVFGNERDGVSPEMIASADKTVIIPMQGFVQSFNISVAAAIGLYHIYNERMQKLGHHGDLSELERSILQAEFSLRSSKNPERLIEEILERTKV
ncbi:MAG TPA: RNA methyltransferase [Bdellovibrionales bacterium]|nr:RNA methyltransferase [Bdellovibrionales bacterium]